MKLNALQASRHITESYRRYLKTFFRLKDSDLNDQFHKLLEGEAQVAKGPYLESTPPFAEGSSIRQLIEADLLHPSFKDIGGFPLDRPLFGHQERSVRKVIRDRRNVVISTGTGSGKTECFLFPILDHLLREQESGTLGPGVRALLLYPMNALANDQLKRLRDLLAPYPDITFGRYVGETETKPDKAEERFRTYYPEERRLPNELLSREEMRQSPPNILLTNYAMLEYLLLRPEDCQFFDDQYAQSWKFIVLDEAHIYNGAVGIEMAMLLRRLKDRVTAEETGDIRCMATSATLGGEQEDLHEVATFASDLFGESFEWDVEDPHRQDIVTADRATVASNAVSRYVPDWSLYRELARLSENQDSPSNDPLDDFAAAAVEGGIPQHVVDEALEKASAHSDWRVRSFLFHLLSGDQRLQTLHEQLSQEPSTLEGLRHVLGSPHQADSDAGLEDLYCLVDLAIWAKPSSEGLPHLPARYHLFLKALEGAFLQLYPERKLFLARKEYVEEDGDRIPVFELAGCRQCGQPYLIGRIRSERGVDYLHLPKSRDEQGQNRYFMLQDAAQHTMPELNEDGQIAFGEDIQPDSSRVFALCTRCGCIGPIGNGQSACSCDEAGDATVYLLEVKTKQGRVTVCPGCGNFSPSIVRRLLTGQDATTSVVASALYQEVPPSTPRMDTQEESQSSDPWVQSASSSASEALSGSQRNLLIFSDSRQNAAFFASYFDRTYQDILRRQVITQVLSRFEPSEVAEFRVQDLVEPIIKEAQRIGLFEANTSLQQKRGLAWKWLMRELIAIDRRNSLEGLGLMGFALVRPETWEAPQPLLQEPWNLSPDEAWKLIEILVDSFRREGAVTFPDQVSPSDSIFAPRNREFYFQLQRSSHGVFSWLPSTSGVLNRRLDFLMKYLVNEAGHTVGEARTVANDALEGLWKYLSPKDSWVWKDHFQVDNVRSAGIVRRVHHTVWNIRTSDDAWYRCSSCKAIWPYSLRAICPTYKCNGTLRDCDPEEEFAENHYWRIYRSIEPIPMNIEEHTAQLTAERAAELQQRFVDKKLNILSCSTTFELGVDVGELQAVLLRNMPPYPSNYTQRAGRAGRRSDATALAVTFAQRRSHDLGYFQYPERMVAGKIRAPRFEIRNEKIVRRHVHAVALAYFWKDHPNRFGQVQSFFEPGEELESGLAELRDWLKSRPANLKSVLTRIVPEAMHDQIGVATWDWVDGLVGGSGDNPGAVVRVALELQDELELLETAKARAYQANRRLDYITESINTIKRRPLINFLAIKGVLPKYGFPVDVVELETRHHGADAKRVELQRDLKLAISEYAPGSEVVAAKSLWKSYGMKRISNLAWPEYLYAICRECGCYHRVRKENDNEQSLSECHACHEPLGRARSFIIPEFGFVTSNQRPGNPGDQRPVRTYASEIYFAGHEKEHSKDAHPEVLNEYQLSWVHARQGRLAVINAGINGMGFRVCYQCGFADAVKPSKGRSSQRSHKTPWGEECHGQLMHRHLGHEFETDVFELRFLDAFERDFRLWWPVLYALLEGASSALHIARDDLDGCLYPYSHREPPALIIFDNVPGGAGHVGRIGDQLPQVLSAATSRVDGKCGCGPETSCYGCLRNYFNQYLHEDLSRGKAYDFFVRLGFGDD